MATTMTCNAPCAGYRPRRAHRMNARRSGMRMGAYALAVAFALLIAYGERWLLAQPAASTELAAATYVFDAMYASPIPVSVHPNDGTVDEEKERTQ
jgi:hypothetical protein